MKKHTTFRDTFEKLYGVRAKSIMEMMKGLRMNPIEIIVERITYWQTEVDAARKAEDADRLNIAYAVKNELEALKYKLMKDFPLPKDEEKQND